MDVLKSYLQMRWGEQISFAGFKNILIDSYHYTIHSKLCDSFLVFIFVFATYLLTLFALYSFLEYYFENTEN
jgi:hypothetical protein